MKYPALTSLVFILFIYSCDGERIVGPTLYGQGDDYLIYSKILKNVSTDHNYLIVLSDSTQGEFFIGRSIEYFIDGLPGLSRETLENYVSVNQEKMKLDRIPNIRYVYSSEYDNSSNKSVGVVVSRVGYNSTKTQAVVTMGIVYAPLAGYGSLIFLVKVGDEWQIQKTMMTWIS